MVRDVLYDVLYDVMYDVHNHYYFFIIWEIRLKDKRTILKKHTENNPEGDTHVLVTVSTSHTWSVEQLSITITYMYVIRAT